MHMQIEMIRFGLEITVRLKRMMLRTLSTQSGSDVNFDDRYLNTPGAETCAAEGTNELQEM